MLAHFGYGQRVRPRHEGCQSRSLLVSSAIVQSMVRVPAWSPHFFAWKPEDWAAFGACVTALVAIIAALVAWRQVREARRLRQEQAQPYVAVAMETSAAAQNMVDLVVKNFGTTAAYDVSVSIDPKPQRSGATGGVEDVSVPKIFRTLVPGQEWRTFWDSGPSRTPTDLPDLHEATVVFYSGRDRRRKRKRHELKYDLDFGDRKSVQYGKIYGLHDAAKAAIDLAGEIRSWSENGTMQGVSVFVRDGDMHDRRRRETRAESRAQHEELVRKGLPVDEK